MKIVTCFFIRGDAKVCLERCPRAAKHIEGHDAFDEKPRVNSAVQMDGAKQAGKRTCQ